MMKNIVIVGGGISGLFSAFYLTKLNYKITIIDNSGFSYGCSHGNAGLIVPSHIIPLAAPGVIPKTIKWMFNSHSPFSFHPKLNRAFISWCLNFIKNSNKLHVNRSIIPIRDISFLSSKLYQELSEKFENSFELNSKGLLMLYKNKKTAEEEINLTQKAEQYGIKTKILSRVDLKHLDPNCEYDVLGGVHYLSDSHLTPNILMQNLLQYLESQGVKLISGETISDIKVIDNKILSVSSNLNKYSADAFLFTSGVWSSKLLKKIDFNIPLMAGKGYSFTVKAKDYFPKIPSILVDARVAVTPMGQKLRIAGTMEIDSINQKIRLNRIKGMVNSFNKYYPKLDINIPKKESIWYGLRPCSPDGLPYIGKGNSYKNLFIATGHAMLGLSLGPATGKLISEIISGNNTSIDTSAFNIERYN